MIPPARQSARPFVLINMAVTADGKIANANRSVTTFGSRRDHAHLLELRATADAVMTGAGTINAQPNITLSLDRKTKRAPLRILVSGRGRANPRAKLFREPGTPLIVLATHRLPANRQATFQMCAHTVKCFGQATLDFHAALAWLRAEWNIRRLLCEGGGRLNATLLAAGLVDELHITHCPLILGGHDAPTLADGPLAEHLTDALLLGLASLRHETGEAFATYRIKIKP